MRVFTRCWGRWRHERPIVVHRRIRLFPVFHLWLRNFKVNFNLLICALDTSSLKLFQETLGILFRAKREFGLPLSSRETTLSHWQWWLHRSHFNQQMGVKLLGYIHEHNHIWLFHFTFVLTLSVLGNCAVGRCRDREILWRHIHGLLLLVLNWSVVVSSLLLWFGGAVRTLLRFVEHLQRRGIRVDLAWL